MWYLDASHMVKQLLVGSARYYLDNCGPPEKP